MALGVTHKPNNPFEQQERNLRTLVTLTGAGLALLMLIARLFWLQFFQFEENFRRSEENRIRRIVIKAERGYIYDRNGVLLVRNRPSYQISLVPYQIKERDSVYQRLLRIVDTSGKRMIDSALLDWSFQRGRFQKFRPLRIVEDASDAQVAFIEERSELFPGVVSIVESRRDYPYGQFAAHVFGYTGEVSEEQLKDSTLIKRGYNLGDRIGQKGLEKEYDDDFRGHDGVKFIEVNAYGREIGMIPDMQHEDAVSGNQMITTLDWVLQTVAEKAFPDSIKGALIALNPQNGEILAMVSSPRIDPNIFSLEKKRLAKEWADVALDSTHPLNNRAIQGTYPPGSVYKFIPAAAALEYEFIDAFTKYPKSCKGGFQFGSRYQRCWKPAGHGSMNVVDALRESCDVFFYQCGLDVDMDKMNEVARRFGFGSKLGIDLPGEKSGLLIDSVSYNKRYQRLGWKWSRGQILNLSIGQGQYVTPLQVASFFGALAYGKGLYQPHIMKEIRDGHGKPVRVYPIKKISEAKISAQNHMVLLQAMEEVVTGIHATGRAAQIKGIRVGGKTGSAENPQGDKTHAWFAAAAPLENPTIAIAAVLENAGGGGAVAAPVVAKVLRAYFEGVPNDSVPRNAP